MVSRHSAACLSFQHSLLSLLVCSWLSDLVPETEAKTEPRAVLRT